MRSGWSSLLLVPVLLVSCSTVDPWNPECYPVVRGGSWDSIEVGFRYRVIESSDASLVGQIFEDVEEEGTPPRYQTPWTFARGQYSIFSDDRGMEGYLSQYNSAINQIQPTVCTNYRGGTDALPSDGEQQELTCRDYTHGTEGELWLGVAELNEEGNPCRLVGHIRISELDGEEEQHLIELESTVIYGADMGGCDKVNGTRTKLFTCPVLP